MPIRFNCDQCDTRIRVPDGSEGKPVRCPKCNTKQRVPGQSKPAPDRDLIDIAGADPKDKSRPKKYNPKKPKVDSAALMDELKQIADEPSVDLDPPPDAPDAPDAPDSPDPPETPEVTSAPTEPQPQTPIDPDPTPDPEPNESPESPIPQTARGLASPPLESSPDEPQPDTDESPSLASHDEEPAARIADDKVVADIADDFAALAADSTEDADESDAIAPPDDEPPQLSAVTDDRRVESTPAIESKTKAPPTTARTAINLDDSDSPQAARGLASSPLKPIDDEEPAAITLDDSETPDIPDHDDVADDVDDDRDPPVAELSALAAAAPVRSRAAVVDDDNEEEPIAQLFADDDDDDDPPVPIISEEPPMPIASPATNRPIPDDAPVFMGLLVISYLLRFLGGLQLVITCVVAVTDPFDISAQTLVAKIIVVLAGLTPALITWAIGEAVSALRHIARNSFR